MTKKDITLADIDQAIVKLGTRFGGVESRLINIEEKQKKQGGLLEDMNHKFDKNINLLTKQMNVKKKVDNHEERITDLEAGYKTVKAVVTLHSEQLGVK